MLCPVQWEEELTQFSEGGRETPPESDTQHIMNYF